MQKILYRDDPYVVLWYNVNLQAYLTDKWTGYTLAPAGDGAPFWNQLRATYLALRPLQPAALPAVDTSREWVWALAVAVVAGGAVACAPSPPPRGAGGRMTKPEARPTREDDR